MPDKHAFRGILLGLSLVALSACATSTPLSGNKTSAVLPAGQNQPGDVVRIEPLGTQDLAAAQMFADDFPGDIRVANSVALYRVVYWTRAGGVLTQASGLLAMPQRPAPPKGVVIYLHGTTMTRAQSPSEPERADGDQEAAIFAGNGYLAVLPDYIGLGVSGRPQAYVVTAPQVEASIDLLRAVRQVASDMGTVWAPDLYMMGFSQGGQSVAGLHRELERNPLPDYNLKGSIGIAGPYDLKLLTLQKLSPPDAFDIASIGYVAFATYAYSVEYDHPLTDAFTPEFAALAQELFSGSRTPEEIASELPDDARKLFRPAFLQSLQNNPDNWFARALAQNETFAWAPTAPFRIYFGTQDTNVRSDASMRFHTEATARGGNVSLHNLGPVDHQASAAMTYAPALDWFNELSAARE